MNATQAIELALLLPLASAGLTVLFGRRPNVRETATLLVAGALFLTVLTLLPGILAGDRPAWTLLEILPGLALAFAIEPLGMLFALVASALWIVTSIYSIGYMRGNDEGHQTRFYACFAIAIFAAIGVAMAANMLTLFVFYEVLTIST